MSSDRVVLSPRPPLIWFARCRLAFIGVNVMFLAITWLLLRGIGIWGNNIPVGWAWDIVNFVWWIGIGHAGTLISAILLLMQQQWRNSINRFAEAMTIFAVMCAGLYPLLHTGRPWCDYWLFPYPNILGMWPQFRSPLCWDVFAVSTYFTISLLFWFLGLVPDIATLRDRSKHPFAKWCYGAGGVWAGRAPPSTGSATSRRTTSWPVSPPRSCFRSTPSSPSTSRSDSFPAGTRRSSRRTSSREPSSAASAMVLTFGLPLRALYGLKDFITEKHLDWMAKITLATGHIVFYGYILEMFFGWYSGDKYELALINNRLFGPYQASSTTA